MISLQSSSTCAPSSWQLRKYFTGRPLFTILCLRSLILRSAYSLSGLKSCMSFSSSSLESPKNKYSEQITKKHALKKLAHSHSFKNSRTPKWHQHMSVISLNSTGNGIGYTGPLREKLRIHRCQTVSLYSLTGNQPEQSVD